MISCLVALILISSSLSPLHILATPIKELQVKQELIEREKNRFNSGVEQKEIEIKSNDSEISTKLEQLHTLGNTLNTASKKIDKTEAEFYQTAEEIELLHKSISILEKDVSERDSVLRSRIRSIQANDGSIDFIDVLLGTTSISDFFQRYSALNALLEADRKIMKQQSSDIKQLEVKKRLVAENLSEQRDNKNSLQELYTILELQRIEKDSLVQELELEQILLTSEKEKLKSSYDIAVKMSEEIEQEIISLQNRQTINSNFYETASTYIPAAVCSKDGNINEDVFFAKFKSAGAFTGKGQAFIDIANEYHIDPVLMAAIAFHETGSGTSKAIREFNNPGGLMNPATNWSTLLRFDTVEDGLRTTGRTISKLINKGGLTTVSDLGSAYAPLGADNDPTGLNRHWAPNVTKFTNEFGGLIMNCEK